MSLDCGRIVCRLPLPSESAEEHRGGGLPGWMAAVVAAVREALDPEDSLAAEVDSAHPFAKQQRTLQVGQARDMWAGRATRHARREAERLVTARSSNLFSQGPPGMPVPPRRPSELASRPRTAGSVGATLTWSNSCES